MDTLNLDLSKHYSYADYLTWMDDSRRELYDGFIRDLTPSPLRIHQEISINIVFQLAVFFEHKTCKIYFAPFDVRLPNEPDKTNDHQVFTVVQPDISIICDLKKLDDKGCIGAPDFIAEIISPSSAKHDIEEKFRLYEKHGVREYWIVFPESKSVHVFLLDGNGKYQLVGMFAEDSLVNVNIFENLVIDLKEVFKD